MSKFRVALVGCGGISGCWFEGAAARQDVEIVALIDLNREAAAQKAAKYNVPNALITTDLAEALRTTAPDVLFNCTIPEAHAPTTIQALKRGCHVLTEKPLADTMSNARRMLRTAEQTGKALTVVQNYRYYPEIRRLRAFLDSGVIGKITTVQSSYFARANFGGFRQKMEHVLLLDMAIHTFDSARFLTGEDPLNVYCHEWNPAGSSFEHDGSAAAIFEMTGGIMYTYEGSWCAQGCQTSSCASWRIVGEKGTVLWDGDQEFRAEVVTTQPGEKPQTTPVAVPEYKQPSKTDGHTSIIGEFLDCLNNGAVPETCATDNLNTLAMVHGAISSGRSGRKVKIAR